METATVRLLDLWKAARGLESDHSAWQALGLSGQSAISNWRHGRSHATPAVVARMAQEAGEDTGPWLMRVEAERARKSADRAAWEGALKRVLSVAMPIM